MVRRLEVSMVSLATSLSAVDPFNPEMPMKVRRALTGSKVGFAMDLAWTARVLVSREKEAA